MAHNSGPGENGPHFIDEEHRRAYESAQRSERQLAELKALSPAERVELHRSLRAEKVEGINWAACMRRSEIRRTLTLIELAAREVNAERRRNR